MFIDDDSGNGNSDSLIMSGDDFDATYPGLAYDDSAVSFSWGDDPGEGSSTVVNPSSGNITYTYDDGSTLTVGPSGEVVGNTESADSQGNSAAFNRALAWTTRNLGGTAARVLQNVMKNPGASLMTALAAAKALDRKSVV